MTYEITLEKLLEMMKSYTDSDLSMVVKAYDMAAQCHAGQYRDSGEDYISHPLNVAYILASMHLDIDTICAALLHDVVEDTPCRLEDIENEFNETVKTLVDGVTKISNISFSSPKEKNIANTKKILSSVMIDIRIVIIKIADRLHNMRTIEVKPPEKRLKKAYETMDIFVPLAYSLGQYELKNELEDLSFKYLKPEDYKRTLELYQMIDIESRDTLNTMLWRIKELLAKENVDNKIKTRIKHIYGIYTMLSSGSKISEIHDLINLKVLLDSVDECYLTLGRVHKIYHPLNDKFKDFICNPKTNYYQSLHTTVFAPDNRLVQVQIRTKDMENIACYGLPALWDTDKDNSRESMQEKFKNKYQFYNDLKEMNSYYSDNEEFINEVKKELFADKIYVYTPEGDVVELPKGATVVDFAYKLGNYYGDKMAGVLINDQAAGMNTKLKNNDRVRIILNDNLVPSVNENIETVTTKARKRKKDINTAMKAIKGEEDSNKK